MDPMDMMEHWHPEPEGTTRTEVRMVRTNLKGRRGKWKCKCVPMEVPRRITEMWVRDPVTDLVVPMVIVQEFLAIPGYCLN